MLEELEIRNLGPIREALLNPAKGMTAITGETGAGKSMLLSAIQLISGGAADASRISVNAEEAWSQAVFSLNDDSLVETLKEAGINIDSSGSENDSELFISRTVPVSGRSRAIIAGKSVPRTLLAEVTGQLITIHGQADQLRIVSSAKQREFLDMVANNRKEIDAYTGLWEQLHSLNERLVRLRTQENSVRQRKDYLDEAIARIERVNPEPGEDDALKERRTRIENAAQISKGIQEALVSLDVEQVAVDTDETSALQLITKAIQSLHAIGMDSTFAEIADRLQSIHTDLSDVVFSLSNEMVSDDDIDDLDSINSRIHELDELTRRWGPTLADVIAWHDKAVFEREDVDASPEKIAALEEQYNELMVKTQLAATVLSQTRIQAAEQLSINVTNELSSLAMPGAKFEIQVRQRMQNGVGSNNSTQLDSHGCDDIEFLFVPFPQSAPLPMGKSASGGELSRLMLALELSAAAESKESTNSTFIFDEVDAGVGGKAAVELGKRLATLAQHAQVIVVTHLAQVASFAHAQFVVSKQSEHNHEVITSVHEVRGEERIHEIARMLSGSESETSLEHAAELLQASGQHPS